VATFNGAIHFKMTSRGFSIPPTGDRLPWTDGVKLSRMNPCKLIATPHRLIEGSLLGRLEHVTFTATDGAETHEWSADRTEHLAGDFAKVVPLRDAYGIVEQLRDGLTVEFPGRYDLEDIKSRLGS